MATLQKFSSVHATLHNHFNQERHLVSRQEFKGQREVRFALDQVRPDEHHAEAVGARRTQVRQLCLLAAGAKPLREAR